MVHRTPPKGRYIGHELSVMAPPSSGCLVASALGALERAGAPDTDKGRAEALAQVMLAMFERRRAGLGRVRGYPGMGVAIRIQLITSFPLFFSNHWSIQSNITHTTEQWRDVMTLDY